MGEKYQAVAEPDAQWRLASRPGLQFRAGELVVAELRKIPLTEQQLRSIEMAVVEAAGNAIEHAHRFQPDKYVCIQVLTTQQATVVRIHDEGEGGPIRQPTPPSLEAKLIGQEPPRGWGLFLMKRLADAVCFHSTSHSHTVELLFLIKEQKLTL